MERGLREANDLSSLTSWQGRLTALHRVKEQALLAAKCGVDARAAEPGRIGEVGHGGPFETLLPEKPHR